MATSIINQVTNNSNASFCKMPDGTLIQWAEKSIPNRSSKTTITSPIPFVNTIYGISVIGNYNSARNVSLVYANQTNSHFDIHRSTQENDYDQAFRYIAIGRWK